MDGRSPDRRAISKVLMALVVLVVIAMSSVGAYVEITYPGLRQPSNDTTSSYSSQNSQASTSETSTSSLGSSTTATPPDSSNARLIPLTDMEGATYLGYSGGLYPEGSNSMPAQHLAAGISLAGDITPLDANGNRSANGKIVLLTIGMSNAADIGQSFIELAGKTGLLNPNVVIVNGAEGGMTASIIAASSSSYWDQWVGQQLAACGVTARQVQAVWYYEADSQPNGSATTYAVKLEQETVTIMGILHSRYPNLKQAYLSSREYGGYATTTLNPEPYAYSSGFSVKWAIEAQLNGTAALNYDPTLGAVNSPWLSWGPYTWADGMNPRSDGLTYSSSDFGSDGTHPSTQGAQKIATLLFSFFESSPTAKPWFLKA